jgi:hypothetical protein
MTRMARKKLTMKKSEDPMLDGYQFGTGYADLTPIDFLTDEKGFRPASPGFKPSGASNTDLSSGIESWHNIPPVEIWDKGRWFEDLTQEAKKTFAISRVDEHYTWIVPGEGTPGNFLLRSYILPRTVASIETPPHPSVWTQTEKQKGNGKPTTTSKTSTYAHWGTSQSSQAPAMPAGITFRCTGCGHWFDSETKLASHATHCCPGSENWGEDGADWVIDCKCCLTYDETAKCKPGYPRSKKDKPEVVSETEQVEVS